MAHETQTMENDEQTLFWCCDEWYKCSGDEQTGKGHWVVFLADNVQKTLEYFDSIGGQLSGYHPRVEKQFDWLFEEL